MRLGTIATVVCAILAARESCFAANSSPRVYVLAIPAQSLDTALLQFAKQTGLQIGRFGDAGMAAHIVTNPVTGGFTADGALRLLLKDSGWSFRALNDWAYIVVKPGPVADSSHQGKSPLYAQQNRMGNIMNKGDNRD